MAQLRHRIKFQTSLVVLLRFVQFAQLARGLRKRKVCLRIVIRQGNGIMSAIIGGPVVAVVQIEPCYPDVFLFPL